MADELGEIPAWRRIPRITFINFLKVNKKDPGPLGDLARDVLADGGFPLGRRRRRPLGRRVTLTDCVSYLESLKLPETRVIDTMIWAWERWEGCNARAARMRETAGG